MSGKYNVFRNSYPEMLIASLKLFECIQMKTNIFIKLNWESTNRVLLIIPVCGGTRMYFVSDSVTQVGLRPRAC